MLRPIDRIRVYEAAVQQIRTHIESGEWPAGMQLPSERELADQLGIGRPSVREALRILEALDLIEIRLGQGSFVKQRSPRSQHVRLLQSMLQEDAHVVELLEVREILEPQIASLAAQCATDEDIATMEDVVRRMEAALAQGATGVEENIEFHLALTQAVGNSVLYQVHQMLLQLSRDPVARFFQVPGRMRRSLQEHRQVLEAIRGRDPQRAYQAMLGHLRARFATPNSVAPEGGLSQASGRRSGRRSDTASESSVLPQGSSSGGTASHSAAARGHYSEGGSLT
jgi:GntR family transcriptional repressor for pyruvate dehydrogenase complex